MPNGTNAPVDPLSAVSVYEGTSRTRPAEPQVGRDLHAKCRSCIGTAEVEDCDTLERGPACYDCAERCFYPGCGQVATSLLLVPDDSGDSERSVGVCDDCREIEEARAERVRRQARRAALADYAALAEVGL